MKTIEHYYNAFKNSWNDEGRASRLEFWFFMLFHIIFASAFFALDYFTGWHLFVLYLAGTSVPYIVLCVRRLHDTGRNGWWFLINLIPILGNLVFLFLATQKSQPGENKYK